MVVIPSILCAALNLILNYIFINLCGYQAAAYTTFFCYALFCLVHYFFYKKVCREMLNGEKFYDARTILLISLGVICVGMVTMFLNHVLWIKYIIIVIIFVVLLIKRKWILHVLKTILSKN